MIYCQGTACWRYVLVALRTVKLGLTKVGNQTKTLKYSLVGGGECCIPYQFRAEAQKYGHLPRYTADKDSAEIGVCDQKYQVAA